MAVSDLIEKFQKGIRLSSKCQISLEEKVVWLTDYGPQFGTVKWLGRFRGTQMAGIEFVSTLSILFGPGSWMFSKRGKDFF